MVDRIAVANVRLRSVCEEAEVARSEIVGHRGLAGMDPHPPRPRSRCQSPRSRLRPEDVCHGSAAEGGRAHGLDGERCGEQPLPRTEQDRVDDEAVLVD